MGSNYQKFAPGLDNPAADAAVVTPSDDNDLAFESRSLWVGTAGNIKVNMAGSETTNPVTFTDVYGPLPIRVTRIFATDTTATNIVSMW